MSEKTVTLRITEEQHFGIKMQALLRGLTLKDYILRLVEQDKEKK